MNDADKHDPTWLLAVKKDILTDREREQTGAQILCAASPGVSASCFALTRKRSTKPWAASGLSLAMWEWISCKSARALSVMVSRAIC
jgi:hypothetical protein